MSVIFKRLFHKRKSEPQPERGEAAAGTIDDKEDVTATLSIPTDEEELPSCGLHFPMADSGVADLEKPGPAIEVAWDSRIGTRNSQQDSVEVWSSEEEMSVDSVLCDGMGGLAGGERASKLAATGMVNALRTGSGPLPQVMARATAELNNRVKNLCDDQNKRIQAGTTLVAVAVRGRKMFWCSIGDSRIYLWRNRTLQQLNQDDTFGLQLDMLAQAGQITREEALQNPKREALTSYLGMPELHRIGGNQEEMALQPGDLILQCSDGLYRALPPMELGAMMEFVKGDLVQEVRELVDTALQKPGNHDNTSAVLIRVNY